MDYQDEVDHWANGDLPNFAPITTEEELITSINNIISDIDYVAYAKQHRILFGEKPENGNFAIYPLANGNLAENAETTDNFALIDENEQVLFIDSSFMVVIDKYNDAYHGIVPEPLSFDDLLGFLGSEEPALDAANDSNIEQDNVNGEGNLSDQAIEEKANTPVMILVTLADGSVIEIEEGFYNQLVTESTESHHTDRSNYITLPLDSGVLNLSPSMFYALLDTSEANDLKVRECRAKWLTETKQENINIEIDQSSPMEPETIAPNPLELTDSPSPVVGMYPHTEYGERPTLGSQSYEKTYDKNVADLGEGAKSLVQGAASVVGGGASMVGAAAKAAGKLFKSFGQGINDRVAALEQTQQEPHTDPVAENGATSQSYPSHSVMDFHKAQLSMREQAFDEQVGQMWQHDQMRPVKEKIKEIANERGVSFESVLQSLPKDEELKELYTEVQNTIENESELKNSAMKAKEHLNGWLDSYKMAVQRSQHMEESEDYEADLEIEGAKGRMAEKVEQSPLFEDDGQSSYEAFKQKLEAILEKIKELFQSLGRRSTAENTVQPDTGM